MNFMLFDLIFIIILNLLKLSIIFYSIENDDCFMKLVVNNRCIGKFRFICVVFFLKMI